ncbi:translocation protein [Neoconidiobolus thromboides FSU 785]|nr:translocation protein [Neoconidiobolus thromboides FSU 785]
MSAATNQPPKEVKQLADYLLDSKKSGLRARQGKLNGQRVLYFKGKSGINSLMKPEAKGVINKTLETREEAIELLKPLVENQLVIRCSKESGAGELHYTQEKTYEEDFYYVWIYQGSQVKNYFMGILVLAGIFAVVLFPLWPNFMKDGAWYLSMAGLGFLGFLFVITIIRFILYIITKVVAAPGIWLFPNLYEDVGFFESFVPLYAWDVPPPPKKVKSKTNKKNKAQLTSEDLQTKSSDPLLEEDDSPRKGYVEEEGEVEEIVADSKQ